MGLNIGKVLKKVGSVALPVIGGLVGGPLGAAAGGALSGAIGNGKPKLGNIAGGALTGALTGGTGAALVKGGATVGTCSLTVAACSNDASAQCATLAVVYEYGAHPLLPDIPLVPTPDELRYSAVARVS